MTKRTFLKVILVLCAAAGLSSAGAGCDDSGENRGADSDADSDGDADSDADSDSDADECADYRAEYPAEPYGTSAGDVIENLTGFVDGDGNPHDLLEIYEDNTVVALLLANAFDT